MTPALKTAFKWIGIALGVVLVLAAGLAAYIYSVIPTPIGDRPTLQEALFRKPAQALPVDARFVHRSATELAAMIQAGTLRYREHIHEGLASAPAGFIGLLKGQNLGKALVRLQEHP